MAAGGWRFHPQLCDDSWRPEPRQPRARQVRQVMDNISSLPPNCTSETYVKVRRTKRDRTNWRALVTKTWFGFGALRLCTSDCDVCGVDTDRCRNFGCFTFFNHVTWLSSRNLSGFPELCGFFTRRCPKNLVPTCSNQAALVKSFEDLDKARFLQGNFGGCAGQFFCSWWLIVINSC